MLYKALNSETISLAQNENQELDPKLGAILIPENGDRVFLHWYSTTGKLHKTYTMKQPTKINDPVKVVNGTNKSISLKVVYLS
jgi:hypothetical protein